MPIRIKGPCNTCADCAAGPCDCTGLAPVVSSGTRYGCPGVAIAPFSISATNSPTSYGASGLPAGLSINTSTGQITGTPSSAGTSSVTISATNCCGTGTNTLTIVIAAAPSPTIVRRTSSASLSKCGYPEFAGYESTPPKYYLDVTYSGIAYLTFSEDAFCQNPCSYYFSELSGTCNYDRSTCNRTQAGNWHYVETTPSCTMCGPSGPTDTNISFCDLFDPWGGSPAGYTESFTATTHTFTGTNTCTLIGCYTVASGSVTETLSNEFTTALLDSDVTAALPSFSGAFSAGSPSASYDKSTDEVTISKSKAEYKFTLPSISTPCYKLTWIERFTPEGGGSPTDTAKSYLWDGVSTETGVYTLDVPGSEGTTTIVSIVASCACS